MTHSLIIVTPRERAARAQAQQQERLSRAVDAHVEARAIALGYRSAAHLASYAASGVAAWAGEARSFIAWRDAVWQQVLAAIERGETDAPDATLAALPDPADYLPGAD